MTFDSTLLHLSLIPSIGPATVQYLLSVCSDLQELQELYQLSAQEMSVRYQLTPARAHTLVVGLADTALLARELELIEQHNVSWTTIASDQYPALLRAIHMPPTVLYWQGVAPAPKQLLALVGSRQANRYGQRVIDMLVPPLVAHGWTLVSGGAVGIDSMVHQATVDAGGSTCVVLGSGLLHPYPFSNRRLFEKISAQGGCIMSIFPLDMRPSTGNFPARNRVIAGLSSGCVVVQAAQKSGARITAEFALEQGRTVFAVPGSIDDPLSAGCHALIKQGALLVSSAQDLLSELGHEPVKQPDTSHATECPASSPQPVTIADAIVNLCASPVSTDDLMAATALDRAALNEQLFELQLSQRITQTFAGFWRAK